VALPWLPPAFAQLCPTYTRGGEVIGSLFSLQQVSVSNTSDVHWVRRSSRQPNKMVLDRLQLRTELQNAMLAGGNEGLREVFFDGKGRGVISCRKFKTDEFVVEYCGDLLEVKEARIQKYQLNMDENFMFYFRFQERLWCVDATTESGHFGRLINHSKSARNLLPQIIDINGTPHIALIAAKDIEAGCELLYDYGDRRAAVLEANPWLKT
jgi:[histone H4]-lysine20 N-methyltransferase SETD8